jgi:hypothetical protein
MKHRICNNNFNARKTFYDRNVLEMGRALDEFGGDLKIIDSKE